MSYFNRKIMPELESHMKFKQATIVTGIRRSGKTTLVKKLLEKIDSDNKIYLDLELISNRMLFNESNYENVLTALKNTHSLRTDKKLYIALDEIQFVKNTPSIVKYLYDNYDIKFILTGSSTYYMKNLFSESLSGRKKIFELYTLDFSEFLEFKNENPEISDFKTVDYSEFYFNKFKNYYDEFIKFGGIPDVVLSEDVNQKKDILNDILDSYLKIDIKNFLDFQNYDSVYKILKLLSSRAGSKLDVLKIANASDLSRTTIAGYIELFEGTYLIKKLPVLSNNPDREISKTSKIYFHDNGILNILSDVSGGVQFENAVFNQLKTKGDLRYYSLKSGREIDFILNREISLETKEYCGDFDVKRLQKLSTNINLNICKLIFRYPSQFINENYIWGGNIL